MLIIHMIVILVINGCCLLSRLGRHMVFFRKTCQATWLHRQCFASSFEKMIPKNKPAFRNTRFCWGTKQWDKETMWGVRGFRLQYKDIDFDEFINLKSTSDIQNKATLKVFYLSSALSPSNPCSSSVEPSLDETASISSVDTDILSSSGSSSSSLRCEPWPDVFPVPEFVYDVELQLQRANTDFQNNDILFSPSPKIKSDIIWQVCHPR